MIVLIPAFGQLKTEAKWGWAKNTGGQTIDLVSDSLGNLCVLGNHTADVTIDGQTVSGAGAYVAFYDSTAKFLSLKSIASTGTTLYKLFQDNLGSIYACGSFTGTVKSGAYTFTSKGKSDGILIKLDAKGNILNAIQYGGVNDDYIHAVQVDSKGFMSMVISIGGTNFIYKYDAQNKELWNQSLYTAFVNVSYPNNVSLSMDDYGFIYVTSVGLNSATNENKLYVRKYDDVGNLVWLRLRGSKVNPSEK